MGALEFLPHAPLPREQLLLFGLLLVGGLLGGELAARLLSLPRVFGYAAAGLALGSSGFGLVEAPLLHDARVFADLALGLYVFDLGRRVDLGWLRRDGSLLATAVTGCVLTFVSVFAGLRLFHVAAPWAAVAAAIAVASAPPVLMSIAADVRAEGQVVERALLLTAFNGAVASVAVVVLTATLHAEHGAAAAEIALHPLYLLIGTALLALVLARGLLRVAVWCGKREDAQFILVIGAVLVAVGLARTLKLPVMLTLLVLGLAARGFDRARSLLAVELGGGARLFLVALFVLTGATLRVSLLREAVLPALVLIGARALGQFLGTLLPAVRGPLGFGRAALVALALQPMSATALLMALDVAALYPLDAGPLTALVLSAVALMELGGPLAVQFALRRAGEAAATAPGAA